MTTYHRKCQDPDTDDVASGYVPNRLQIIAACAVMKRSWSQKDRLLRERVIEERHGQYRILSPYRGEDEPGPRAVPIKRVRR